MKTTDPQIWKQKPKQLINAVGLYNVTVTTVETTKKQNGIVFFSFYTKTHAQLNT